MTDPPVKIVKTLKERDRVLLPRLTGVINAPTLRHDGTILYGRGYDKQTGLLFDPLGVEFRKIPDLPHTPRRLLRLTSSRG